METGTANKDSLHFICKAKKAPFCKSAGYGPNSLFPASKNLMSSFIVCCHSGWLFNKVPKRFCCSSVVNSKKLSGTFISLNSVVQHGGQGFTVMMIDF